MCQWYTICVCFVFINFLSFKHKKDLILKLKYCGYYINSHVNNAIKKSFLSVSYQIQSINC